MISVRQEKVVMLYKSLEDFKKAIEQIVLYSDKGSEKILDENRFRSELIDRLVYNAAFNENKEIKANCRFCIRTAAPLLNVFLASIQELYEAKGKGKYLDFTVPAINIRGMTYDVGRVIFQTSLQQNAGPIIFEIARSEIGYTNQWPSEYSAVLLAAAIKEGYKGPLFIQGDHFQVKAKIHKQDPTLEVEAIKLLIKDAIDSGFFNIDIDTSTLVDLSKDTLDEQQRENYELCALFTDFIRSLEPENINVSVGGEIGEVGGKNSTPEELMGFMDGYLKALENLHPYQKGISKISVQTGTTHGGVPLPDGTIAEVKVDFDTLQRLSALARQKYGMAGAVQHGASTLPDELFHKFPEVGTAEIHLATGFQNIIYDHEAFPAELRNEIYDFLREKFASERKEDQTDEQFIYKTRKKGMGPFKKQMWDLSEAIKAQIRDALKEKFGFLFDKLGIVGYGEEVIDIITPPDYSPTLEREIEMVK